MSWYRRANFKGCLLFFSVVLLLTSLTGCGLSDKDVAEGEIVLIWGLTFFSWPIIEIWVTRVRNVKRYPRLAMGAQYLLYALVGMQLSNMMVPDTPLLGGLIFSIVGIPYLMLSTMIFGSLLPKKLFAFLPSFVLVPHIILSVVLYLSGGEGSWWLQPFHWAAGLVFGMVPLCFFIIVPYYLIVVVGAIRKRKTESPTQTDGEAADTDES